MDEIKTEKQLSIEKISRGLKDLVFSIILMIIVVVAFLYIAFHNDLNSPEGEKLILYSGIPFLVAMILSLISIERIAKILKKKINVWFFLTCFVFPIFLLFAALYFFIIAVFRIIKLSKDAEQFSAVGSPGQALLNNRGE